MTEKIDWKKLVERDTETLIVFQVVHGRKYYPEVTGLDYKPRRIKYENRWILLPVQELKEEDSSLRKKCKKDPEFLEDLAKKLVKSGDKLLDLAKEVSASSKKGSNKELAKRFQRCNLALERFAPFIWVTYPAERLLTGGINKRLEKIYPDLSETERSKLFTILTTPQKETNAGKEYRACLKITTLFKKHGEFTPQIEKEIKKLHNQYAWLGAVRVGWTYLREPYAPGHYKKVLVELAEGKPKRELDQLEKQSFEHKTVYKKLIERKEIDKNLVKDSELLQEYIFLRTLRGEYVVRALLLARPLLTEIAARSNLELEDIIYFIPDEIVKLLEAGEVPDFESRKSGYRISIEGEKIIVAQEKRAAEEEVEEVSILKGSVAQPGFAKGKVKVILDAKEVSKVKKGDVLVAKMTSPDMMLGIRKAAAIVTDEGGITCHAAIVSREFKIPCIIGTEKATKAFKDGDLVEVDAEKGIVRTLRSA